jgi:hypothetical protein
MRLPCRLCASLNASKPEQRSQKKRRLLGNGSVNPFLRQRIHTK